MGHQRRVPRPVQSFEGILEQLSTLVSPKNDFFAPSCANYHELMLLCAPPDLSSGAAVVAVDHGAISAWYNAIGLPRRAPPVEVSGSSTHALLLHILADYCTILSHRYVSTIAPYEVLHKLGEPLLNFVGIIIQRGEVPLCPAMLAHCVHAVGELASRQAGPSPHGYDRDYAFKLLQQAHSHLLTMRWRCALAHASQLQLKLTELSPQPILDPTLAGAYDERNATRPVIPRLVIEDATATDTSVHNVVANNHNYTPVFY
ncbi:hypothetical protein EXIGLDRAFT_735981 [Exidia glandulosa HHB12029]|uniref:Uncharacterized protein n=1 Tax=Exidia glandulosa HHB12029 TaxID=1314781 RepID=A0A166ATN6_EXIGL|nr:hypothetical protein EXIGLDRAFT_735981 [Exidia glandulosa HHB12029]